MTAMFRLMDRAHDADAPTPTEGKVVLSRLAPTACRIMAPAPSLKLVMEGAEYYEIDGSTVRVEPGQFLYLDAGAECHAINREDTIGLCLLIAPAAARDEAALASGHDPVLGRALVLSSRTSAMGRVLAHYGQIIAKRPELGPIIAPELVARVEAAVAEPLAESRAAIESLNAVKAGTRRALYQKLERARDHLHACDSRAVPLAELAQVAGLSQFHLARYFRHAFGQSPIAYHRALRLDRAIAALEQGASVASVAEAAGYSDASALSHAFRRRFGRPPQHWIARARNG